MEAILDGLLQPIKEKTRQCISTKELWIKLEKLYSVEQRAEPSLAILENNGDDEEPCSYKKCFCFSQLGFHDKFFVLCILLFLCINEYVKSGFNC